MKFRLSTKPDWDGVLHPLGKSFGRQSDQTRYGNKFPSRGLSVLATTGQKFAVFIQGVLDHKILHGCHSGQPGVFCALSTTTRLFPLKMSLKVYMENINMYDILHRTGLGL